MKLSIFLLLAAFNTVIAQQSAWGQCGGNGWSGQTSCISGYFCSVLNPYYSQCIPGTGGATTTSTTITTLSTSTTQSMTTSSATTTSTPSGSFAKTLGTLFNIDGKTGYFAGTNSYWIGFLPNNADVDLVMSHLQTSGLKILRVWGFNDVNNIPGTGTVWYQSLSGSTPTINTGANGLQRLDYVVKSAEAHGIKLIINFVNNWDDYGGIKAYTNYYGGSHTTWYTNTAAQAQYRTYIKAVVSRYITSTAVFAWELANEPRCSGCNTDVIYKWAADTSAYVKSLDPNHMVALGDEGFNPSAGDGSYPYQTSEGVSFVKNLGISTLDFGVYHMYASAWGVSESTFPAGWIQSHAAACVAAKKPCLFEEYGTTNSHSIEANWQSTTLNAAGNGADLFWQHGDSLSSGQSPNDGYTIYYGTGEWNTLVTQHVQSIRVKYP